MACKIHTELMDLCIAAHMAAPVSTVTLDNQALVDHGPEEPHGEASDMDMHRIVATAVQSNNILACYILGHREASLARDAQELDDITRVSEVDRLAKLATSLPLPLHNPTCPSSILVGGTEAPAPASTWIAPTSPYQTYHGAHGSSWLPL